MMMLRKFVLFILSASLADCNLNITEIQDSGTSNTDQDTEVIVPDLMMNTPASTSWTPEIVKADVVFDMSEFWNPAVYPWRDFSRECNTSFCNIDLPNKIQIDLPEFTPKKYESKGLIEFKLDIMGDRPGFLQISQTYKVKTKEKFYEKCEESDEYETSSTLSVSINQAALTSTETLADGAEHSTCLPLRLRKGDSIHIVTKIAYKGVCSAPRFHLFWKLENIKFVSQCPQ